MERERERHEGETERKRDRERSGARPSFPLLYFLAKELFISVPLYRAARVKMLFRLRENLIFFGVM